MTISNSLSANDIHAANVVVGTQIINLIGQYIERGGRASNRDDLHNQVLEYLTWLSDQSERIELRGLEQGDRKVIPLHIETVYVPPEAVVLSAWSDEYLYSGEEDASKAQRIDLTLDEITRLGRQLVITGDPGSGKTTSLFYIAWRLATTWLGQIDKVTTHGMFDFKNLPLPIYLPLAAYAKHLLDLGDAAKAAKTTLAAFVPQYFLARHANLKLPDDFFVQLMDSKQRIVLLLDGLDEIANTDQRRVVREAIESFVGVRSNLFAIVTCRTSAYRQPGTALMNFRELLIQPLDMDRHIVPMIQQGYRDIYPNSPSEAADRADQLVGIVRQFEQDLRERIGADIKPLITSPLMVRLLLIVHYGHPNLSDDRADLYERAVVALMEADYARDERVRHTMTQDWKTHRAMAELLAFQMHTRGRQDGLELDEADIKRILRKNPNFASYTEGFLTHAQSRGGVLEYADQSKSYRFVHLTFQEFLAARHIFEEYSDKDIADMVGEFVKPKTSDSWWREPLLLLSGLVSSRVRAGNKFLRELVSFDGGGKAEQLAAAELAASAALEWKQCADTVKAEIADGLARNFADVTTMNKSSPALRASAGRRLSRLGDPRFSKSWWSLPNDAQLGFVRIASGKFDYGTTSVEVKQVSGMYPDNDGWHDAEMIDQTQRAFDLGNYFIATYPTTVAQWRAYVDDIRDAGLSEPTIDLDSLNGLDNHPVVWVSWHDALAYCAWLDNKIRQTPNAPKVIRDLLSKPGWHLTLPSEMEWEKAARGKNGRLFPWGAAPDAGKANCLETGIGRTTAVGCFPNGASIRNCQDMGGNVWEWTRSAFGYWDEDAQVYAPMFGYPYRTDVRDKVDADKPYTRVMRGGAFGYSHWNTRCACRGNDAPEKRYSSVGFRIAISRVGAITQ